MPPNHTVVAMSGGVDSSVAAVLLARQGHTVSGVTMDIWCPADEMGGVRAAGCCGAESARDAAEVCRSLGIDHTTMNFRAVFEEEVITPFVEAYASGLTPNPCIECNRAVKWGALLDWAERFGADGIATGHYARVDGGVLKRGADRSKDQSYALYMLTPDQLSRTLFPCGEYEKAEIRAIAAEAGLAVADREESQEICFLPDDDYLRLVAERKPGAVTPGPIVDLAGDVLGEHTGFQAFTPGQRKGLGLAGGPWYVVALDPERNTVIVGPEEAVYASDVIVARLTLRGIDGARFEASVMTRYRGPEDAAEVEVLGDGRARVRFAEPQRAPAPGQAAVMYDGEVVLGGGTVVEVARDE